MIYFAVHWETHGTSGYGPSPHFAHTKALIFRLLLSVPKADTSIHESQTTRGAGRLIGDRLDGVLDLDFLRYIHNRQHPLKKDGT